MNKILTIVIPSYNTVNYIDECLPTILNITNRRLLEVLLVNDGSKDNTLEKCVYYQKKYPDVIRVIDKENGGHGSVINCGIREATGKYFKIIDGDDWVKDHELERLINDLQDKNIDLVVNPYILHNESSSKEFQVCFGDERTGNISEIFSNVSEEFSLHAITYKTELLKNNDIKVRENCFYEDTEYILYPLCYITNVYILDYPVYVYRIGTVTQSVNPESAYRNRDMHRKIVFDCINYYQNNMMDIDYELRKYCEKIVISRIISQYNIYLKGSVNYEIAKEVRKWNQELKNFSPIFYNKSSKFHIKLIRTGNIILMKLIHFLYKVKEGL